MSEESTTPTHKGDCESLQSNKTEEKMSDTYSPFCQASYDNLSGSDSDSSEPPEMDTDSSDGDDSDSDSDFSSFSNKATLTATRGGGFVESSIAADDIIASEPQSSLPGKIQMPTPNRESDSICTPSHSSQSKAKSSSSNCCQ
jgi:hypothetical protein